MIDQRRRLLVRIAILAAALGLFFAYAFFVVSGSRGFNSPDETSNAFFSSLFRDGNRLWYYEPLNFIAENLVHPRSMRVEGGFLVPGGFIGLPLFYGILAKAAGFAAIPFIFAVIAVAAVFAWGRLIGFYAGKVAGRLAMVLLALQPAWWYWAARPFMPNAPFLAFLILAAYFVLVRPLGSWVEKKDVQGLRLLKAVDAAIGGALFAIALAIRPSELPWLVIGGIIVLVGFRRRIIWSRAILFCAAAALFLVPILFLNRATYGSLLGLGYVAGAPTSAFGGLAAKALGPAAALFPLGFAPRIALGNLLVYGIATTWWWTALVAAALVYLAVKRKLFTAKALPWLGAAIVAALWLVLFYGSWRDTVVTSGPSLASSFIRYWLPLSVLSTIPVAIAAAEVMGHWRVRRAYFAVVAGTTILAAVSAAAVFFTADDGLLAIRRHLLENRAAATFVFEKTPEQAVIITDTADKYLFPARKVIQPLRNDYTYSVIGRLAPRVPLYYFGITLPDRDFAYLRDKKLFPQHADIAVIGEINGQTLYQITSFDSKKSAPPR